VKTAVALQGDMMARGGYNVSRLRGKEDEIRYDMEEE
jgi:hypothetical protein